ncbi:MAG TPA: PaaI family thioesterase [Actinomycetota bacterium]
METFAPMTHEPVRGSYPDPAVVALPGTARMGTPSKAVIPRPPIHHLFGLVPVDAGPGTSTFEMPASPWLQTSAGVFFGATAALVADAPLGGAILSEIQPWHVVTTSELSLSFLRPATVASAKLTSRASLIGLGRSQGLAEATVNDAEGRLLAHSTSRYFILALPPQEGVVPPEPAPIEDPVFDTPDPWARPIPPALVDPDLLELCRTKPGLELMTAGLHGTIPPPPFAVLFGIGLTDVREGTVSAALRATEWLASPARTVYGGVLAFLADMAMTSAVTTTLPAASSCATLDITLHFLRPGICDGRDITVSGEVVHRGRTLAVTRAQVANADGKPLVVATGSSMVLEGRPWADVAVADVAAGDPRDNDE